MTNDTMSAAVAFFYIHAGYSHNPATETPEEGRQRCARELAAAELLALEAGMSFAWSVDNVDSSDFMGRHPEVPADFPVKVIGHDDDAGEWRRCGECGRCWDDAVVTDWTPAPSARCPFEYYHADPWQLWQCLARDEHGEVVASLGGVDFGRDGQPYGDPYRRIVEAELADEYLERPGRETT